MKHPFHERANKDLTININHSLDEILKRHKANIELVYFTPIPNNYEDAVGITELFNGLNKNLETELILLNRNGKKSSKTEFVLGFTHYVQDELYRLVALKDDCLVFFPNDFIFEVLVDDIHYICRVTEKDLKEHSLKIDFPQDF